MPSDHLPGIGDWFKDETGSTFEVVALDEEGGHMEIQYFDGAVAELDLDSWAEQEFEPVEPPEDWSGSLDIEREDYGVDLEGDSHLDWRSPLDDLER